MAAKTIQATMLATASPPGSQPTSSRASSVRRPAIPPLVMMLPAAMKNGMERKTFFVESDSILVTMRPS